MSIEQRFAFKSAAASAAVALMIFGAGVVVAQPAPAGDTGTIQEITVTARRVTENLQDVPVAVTAVTPNVAATQQMVDIVDLSASVPNLIINPNTTTTDTAAVYIRGLGQDDSTANQEQQVAIYIDDVYLPHAQGDLMDLGDFERIEVLRGPQGTLYGRNTDGGAIKFVTVKPSLMDTTGWVDVTVGSFARADISAAFTTPLIDNTLGVKVEGVSRVREGYIHELGDGHDVNRIDRQTGRIALRYVPSSDITWDFTSDASRDHSGLQAPVPIAPVPGGRLGGGYGPLYGNFFITGTDAPDRNTTTDWGAANTVAWDSPIGTLKSVTSYRRLYQAFGGPLAGLPGAAGQLITRTFDDRAVTQEFQLASKKGSALTYVAGLFYLDDRFHNKDLFFILDDYFQTSKSYAAYGDLTYKLTPALSVEAGARYTKDDKVLNGNYIGLSGPFSVSNFPLTFHNVSPKGAVNYQLTEHALLYTSATQGYQAGGYQGFPQALTDITVQTLKPAKETAYEIGSKNELWDRRATLNLAVFYSLLHDKQVSAFNPATLGYVSNTVDETIKGAELEFDVRLTPELELTAFTSWLHAVVSRSAYPANPLVPPVGAKAAFVPEYIGKIGFVWDHPISERLGHLFASAHLDAVSKIYYDILDTPFAAQKARALVDARFGYRTRGRLEIALGGKNLTNVQWFDNASTNGTIWPMPLRTWSLEFKYKQ